MTYMPRTRVAALVLITATMCLLPVWQALAQSPAPAPKPAAASRAWPLTRPEATNYTETSRYDDVAAFVKQMAKAAPQIHVTTFGYTYEGKPLLLAVYGAPDATPEKVLATGKTRIYIQANIHAGEVEGKEAMLWMLRSIAKGERAGWLPHVVLLINPIFNADGNDRVNVRNRGAQLGPIGGMGQRENAQSLDLNRDNTKMETAEARSVGRLLTAYDPHIAIDLHTTDGSAHGYYLTYDTSGSPNTAPAIAALVRKGLLPWVTKTVKAKHNWDYFYYGGVYGQGERAWRGDLDLYKPRYTQTYWGLRNRIGILSETYSYATFEDRIKATYWFVEEIINFAVKNGAAIRKVTAEADAASIVGEPQAIRNRLVKYPDPVQVVLADLAEERNPYVPDRPMRRRVNGSERVETLPHYGLIEPTEFATAPRSYVIQAPPPASAAAAAPQMPPPGMIPGRVPPSGAGGMPPFMGGPSGSPEAKMTASIIDRLEAHGVKYFKTTTEQFFKGERFKITTSKVEDREYQGTHKIRSMTGEWQAFEQKLPAGSLVIPMDQPLARLAFVLLDPMSDDGFMAWNICDAVLGTTPAPEFYPVMRTMEAVSR
jgi:hypothetical protein